MTVTIQTSVRHNRCTNSTFLYIRSTGQPRCGYAIGYGYQECPCAHSKVALYLLVDATCPVIVGYIMDIISHTRDSVSVLISPCLKFYTKNFHPEPYYLHIPIQWIELTPLQVVSQSIYLTFHPSHTLISLRITNHYTFLIFLSVLVWVPIQNHLPFLPLNIFVYHVNNYYHIGSKVEYIWIRQTAPKYRQK